MQKIIQRTQMAERQAARRLARKQATYKRQKLAGQRDQAHMIRREEGQLLRKARVAQREDWELGPLAPRRDVGDSKRTYGAIDGYLHAGAPLESRKRWEILKQVGGTKVNIVKGDRVVMLEGRDKGKIGKVMEVDVKEAKCRVEGLNMVDVIIPKWLQDVNTQAQQQEVPPTKSEEKGVPLDKVRLIYALPDEETGVVRDVIVNQLINTNFRRDPETNKVEWDREIVGLGISVPWPPKEPEKDKPEYPIDTLRIDIDKKTFVPTLLNPPMPSSIIDELRNRYSKFRTRHDPEYIAAKVAEEEEKVRKRQEAEEMISPMREINRKLRKLKKAKGKGQLSERMLEKIGEVMARKRQLKLERAGVVLEEGREDQEWEDIVEGDPNTTGKVTA